MTELADLLPFGDELFILVMGPGLGESILVHWPPDHWLVVDSFHRTSRTIELHPAADALVAFGGQADAVVLTHPHYDHTGGLATLIDHRKPGGLVGWWPDDAAGERWSTANASLATRQGNNEHAVAAIHRAWRNEPGSRWELHGDEGPRQIGDATIRVLAPLQTTIDHSKTIAEPDYNEMSSAMLVTWGECDILLGADLINARGWNSLEAVHGPGAFSQTKGMKVAHHGSKEAQHVVALGNPPPTDRTYLATPYNRGRKVPDYRDGGDVDLLLTVMHRLLMAGHHGPVPSAAADGDISRNALAPQLLAAGPLVVELGAVRPPISNCWVSARWARDGSLLGTERGAGSLSVVA